MSEAQLGSLLHTSWTRDPHKVELFMQDTWFLEAATQCIELVADPASVSQEMALLLIKPDGVVSGAAATAVDWLDEQGFHIHYAAALPLGRNDIRALWLYQWSIASAERRALADVLRSLCPSLVLVVSRSASDGLPTAVELTARKGPTAPAKRQPGQLRYALGGSSYLLNLVHSPDEPADVLRELAIYFDTAERAAVLHAVANKHDATEHARTVAATLHQQHGGFVDDVNAARTALAPLAQPEEAWETLCRRLLADASALDAAQRWNLLVVGSSCLPMRTSGGEVSLHNPGPQAWSIPPAPGQFTQSIERTLVHRSAVAETFITALAPPMRSADGTLVVRASAQIARAHYTYSDHRGAQHGHIDLLQLLEASRQAAIAAAHRVFAAAHDSAFVVRRFSGSFTGQPLPRTSTPQDLVIDISFNRTFADGERTTGADVSFAIFDDTGRRVADCAGSYSWIPVAQWHSMRRQSRSARGLEPHLDVIPTTPPQAVAPHNVLREMPSNAVLAATGSGVELVVDCTHPTHFDHALDHIPGMLQLEGARQAAVWSLPEAHRSGHLLTSINAQFVGIGELDVPVSIAIAGNKDQHYTIELTQNGIPITTATATLGTP